MNQMCRLERWLRRRKQSTVWWRLVIYPVSRYLFNNYYPSASQNFNFTPYQNYVVTPNVGRVVLAFRLWLRKNTPSSQHVLRRDNILWSIPLIRFFNVAQFFKWSSYISCINKNKQKSILHLVIDLKNNL